MAKVRKNFRLSEEATKQLAQLVVLHNEHSRGIIPVEWNETLVIEYLVKKEYERMSEAQ